MFLLAPKKLVIPAVNHHEYISKIVLTIINEIDRSPAKLPMVLLLEIAIYEALKNAIVHGCKGKSENNVIITYGACKEKLFIEIMDPGQGFEYRQHLQSLEQWKHGMGIPLIKSVVDQVEYNEQGNAIKLVKFLSKCNF